MHPMSDVLQVSRKALYVVKDCKTTLSKLTTRVAKLKQVLEDILNDDQEMEDMYLGRRAGIQLINQLVLCPWGQQTVNPYSEYSNQP